MISIIQVAQIYPNSGNPQAGRVYDSNGISPTLDTCGGGNRMPKIVETMEINTTNKTYIRKLTPTECYKLMGFDAADCKKVSDAGISNSQLYKQAGNSIVVNVLEAIFTELGKTYKEFSV
jgi:DNA (cytosine-5)-methyltransferase 1